MKLIYSVAFGLSAFFALNCGSGDEGGYGSEQGSGSAAQTGTPSGEATKTNATDPEVVEVKVNGHDFDPPLVHIKVNQTVRWVWVTGRHNVISGASCAPDGLFSSGTTESPPSTFDHTFEKAGSFSYYCDPHCSIGMQGKVVVD